MTRLPRLGGRIAVDVETNDPHLKTAGPGDVRGDGFVAGVAVAREEDGWSAYYPLRHEGGGNVEDEEQVWRWLRHELKDPSLEIVGTNLQYDLGWLTTYGVQVNGALLDVQLAEPLLDENARAYDLDTLARKYLGRGKPEDELYEWLASAHGGPPSRNRQAGRIWRAPAHMVAPYAIGDVELPLKIMRLQEARLAEESLLDVWDIESRLIRPLLAMRRRGVAVDTQKASELLLKLQRDAREAQKVLNRAASGPVNVWASASLAQAYDRAGVSYPRTQKGNPSFLATWLEQRAAEGCPLSERVLAVRRTEKAAGTFVEGYVIDKAHNGRLHPSFHQLRGGDGGTVTGRLSSSNPNAQNLPSRDPHLGPLIRGLFVPDEGDEWVSHDWSQVEYRLLCHYGRGPSAERARRAYREDPTTDFHQLTAELTGLERKPAKNVNFGLVYGMGKKKLAADLGMDKEEAEAIFSTYHGRQPFVRELSRDVARAAGRRGWVKTLLGRRRRFDFWEPRDWEMSRQVSPMRDRARAAEEWGRVRRAYTHKALNAVIQGGAADLMKKAMVDVWESGVCDVIGAPLLTVHDELCWSAPKTKVGREAMDEARRLMVGVWPSLRVPLMVDEERGPSWGELKE